jgi:hypothetical protein
MKCRSVAFLQFSHGSVVKTRKRMRKEGKEDGVQGWMSGAWFPAIVTVKGGR